MSFMFQPENKNLNRAGRFFSRKSVDIEKKIGDKYLCGDVAVIAYRAFSLSDIIDPHSVPGHEILTEGFNNFLEVNTGYIESEYPIVLEICGQDFTQEEKEMIVRVIKDECDLVLGTFVHEKKEIISSLIFNAVFAVIAYLIYMYFNQLSQAEPGSGLVALVDCFNIFFWVFAWEAAAGLVFRTQIYMSAKKKAAQMASMNIKFFKEYDESTYSVKEQEKLIDEIVGKD